MPRNKNYQISPDRKKQARTVSATPEVIHLSSNPRAARIDMVALLGKEARFPSGYRNIDLTGWLGRGIDAFVWAAKACLEAMLLSGVRETSSVNQCSRQLAHFFTFLTEGRNSPRVATPADLSPLHIHEYVGWLKKRGQQLRWTVGTTRNAFKDVKSVLLEMFAQGHIQGEPARFFKRASLPSRDGDSAYTSLSDAEQERLAQAVKQDLVAVHHGRLRLAPRDVQGLRVLLIAHRQGKNLTPMLEMRRDSMVPGPMPGTVVMRTFKHRSKRVATSGGRAAKGEGGSRTKSRGSVREEEDEFELFDPAEGAVLQQAITSTEALLAEAPAQYRNRIWLYRGEGFGKSKKGSVTCLTPTTLGYAIRDLINRHGLVGDDSKPLRVNFSRMRKSFFDRALRLTDGDLWRTANLMGNTLPVAARHYHSMNDSRKAVAAEFMNEGYLDAMRGDAVDESEDRIKPHLVEIKPLKPLRAVSEATPNGLPEKTPVSNCMDTLNGEYAPRDGHNHCDRYVMCLFCSSFAIVGTVDELWRLFSFQAFANAELRHLDAALGPERTGDASLEDLRDRYRLAIPYINDFTRRQFPAGIVGDARAKTEVALHPFWGHQMTMSRRARPYQPEPD
ncbi:TPA: hypothetical protein QDA97_001572 [Burkholderia vietnamiensis]|nr:hypothetical protein [Burkholderia vietnamiensis]